MTVVATCFCNQLGGIALTFDSPLALDPPLQAPLPFFSDKFVLESWQQSLGFRIVIAGAIVYTVGLIFSIILDIKPRKDLLQRLMKDMRNVDRYGYISETNIATALTH